VKARLSAHRRSVIVARRRRRLREWVGREGAPPAGCHGCRRRAKSLRGGAGRTGAHVGICALGAPRATAAGGASACAAILMAGINLGCTRQSLPRPGKTQAGARRAKRGPGTSSGICGATEPAQGHVHVVQMLLHARPRPQADADQDGHRPLLPGALLATQEEHSGSDVAHLLLLGLFRSRDRWRCHCEHRPLRTPLLL
jgi:hypothetical protein